jgi:hypothetical protein
MQWLGLPGQVASTLHFASALPLQHCHAECGAADFGFSFISCVNGCVLRQGCTTELVWLAAAGSGAPTLRKRAKCSRVIPCQWLGHQHLSLIFMLGLAATAAAMQCTKARE